MGQMKTSKLMKIVAETIIAIILIGCVASICTICAGCSSTTPEVTPIPAPVVDYKAEILGTWESINSKGVGKDVQLEYKPNGICNIYVLVKDKYVLIPSNSLYDIYENKILHIIWSIQKDGKTLTGEDFWHITITGKVMYLSVRRVSKDNDSYVVTLTLKKVK